MSAASIWIANPTSTLACTTAGPSEFGRTWRTMHPNVRHTAGARADRRTASPTTPSTEPRTTRARIGR